jgi:signal transduction histidine kinase
VLPQAWAGGTAEEAAPVDVRHGLEIAADLAASLAAPAIVGRLVERALESGGADLVMLWRLRGEQAVLEESRDRGGARPRQPRSRPLAMLPLLARAAATRRPVLGTAEPREAVIPLLLGGEVIACLVLTRRRGGHFAPAELGTLQLIGNIAALALHNADLYAEAQAANRVQNRLLNTAAHELRTPLTAVSAALSLLVDGEYGDPSPEWRRPVEVAAAKAAELSELVEDLLLAALLEGDQLQATALTFDLRDVVQEALARAEPRIRLLHADVAVRRPAAPVPVSADPLYAGRIIDVLLANALSNGGPHPRVRLSLSSHAGARLVVEDRGRGTTGHAPETVFDAFGLYLGRELAQRLGGTLILSGGRPGRGSTFVLTLPAPS